MKSVLRIGFLFAIGAAAIAASTTPLFAQGRGGGGMRGFGGFSRTQLVTLKEVQAELKFTDDQKKLATDTLAKLNEDRAAARDSAGGDFAAVAEKNAKLTAEADAKIAEKLDDAQKKRLLEIFVQQNKTGALADAEVQKALGLDEAAVKKLAEARAANREAMTAAMQELGQDATREQRQEKMATVQKTAEEKIFSAISADQKAAFEKLGGAALTIDTTPLQPRGGARGGRQPRN